MAQITTQSTTLAGANPHMVDPGQGINLWVLGILITIKAFSNETEGSYSLVDAVVRPGRGSASHFHTKEVESWYLTEGELDWKVDNKLFHATEGCFINLPRYAPHSFINRSDKTAYVVISVAPSGFEQWFLEVGKPVSIESLHEEPPLPTLKEIQNAVVLAKKYGVYFQEEEAATLARG